MKDGKRGYVGGEAGVVEPAQGLKAWERIHYAGFMSAEPVRSWLDICCSVHSQVDVLCVHFQCSLEHDQATVNIVVRANGTEPVLCCRLHSLLNADEGMRPLIALVHVLQPECQCVFNSMLSNWFLVKDRQSECSYRFVCFTRDNMPVLAQQDDNVS